ncbi:MAG: RsmB/NOP family class I SAM-dependent RNA methyltransferase [Planctomycetota bacterium]
MTDDPLELAWRAIEDGASLSEACVAAGVEGRGRERLIGELRRILAGEARLERLQPGLASARARLAALDALDDPAPRTGGDRRAPFDAHALRAREAELLSSADPVLRLAQRGSVSDAVAAALHRTLGEGAQAFLDASWRGAGLCLRVNVARTTRDELAERLRSEGVATRPGALSPWALRVVGDGPLPRTRAQEEGLFEVQDEASQLVALVVDPLPGAPTVDVCAGAGGKTLALCARLGKKGRVVALDVSRRRLRELRSRAARAQAFNLLVHEMPRAGAELPAPLCPLVGRAARVLVDAPCSGLGVLARKPDLARRVDLDVLRRLPEQQLEIARGALSWLRPDGRLIYATCTPLREENEGVVERLCAEEGIEALPMSAWLPAELHALAPDRSSTVLRLLPHVHGTDAFTVHVLRRRSSRTEPRAT